MSLSVPGRQRLVPFTAPILITVLIAWASAFTDAAQASHSHARTPEGQRRVVVPDAIAFRETAGSGLMVKVWIDGHGPYAFSVDTGAGCTIVSDRVAREAKLALDSATVPIRGLSGSTGRAMRGPRAHLAAGTSHNALPSTSDLLVMDSLPSGVDGVLDPSIAFWPLGYVLDMREGILRAFDPVTSPVLARDVPNGGTVLAWARVDGTMRPYVSLGSGRTALLDTGSQFGLAIGAGDVRAFGTTMAPQTDPPRSGMDLGGGTIRSRRGTTPRLRLGSMVLWNVPTDVLDGASGQRTVLLGRDALRPFTITFDPHSRLIRIDPGSDTSDPSRTR